ncbi:Anaerobic selenocysteine-containing dehydrogenase [Amycolatopsis xylanica]|uniref:Anaerobic selenocysteine-containing dehydrogenase n=1 Tax=Amycolatopsis xylanica TaxID=589385 RepID=A0A1H3N490_9PSEU|nr:Anaerobic selenocysteine-containing dehydrogenase [Amycolatopsis xylanica]
MNAPDRVLAGPCSPGSRRLTTPLRRISGKKGSRESEFEPISWDEAFAAVAARLLALRDEGEARSIATWTSGSRAHGTGSLMSRLFALLGSPNGPGMVDPGSAALASAFGLGMFTNGYGIDGATGQDDLGSSKYLLFLGTNQAQTHPLVFDYLRRDRTQAKLVVVDPRRTPTTARADEWLASRPHTDLALVLGMLSHIITTGRQDRRFVAHWVTGFEELRDHLRDHGYTPDWAARITGLPADTIRRIAEEYAAADRAAIFCDAGVSHQRGAFDAYRALTFLAAVTGNIGIPGGGCNFMHHTWPGDLRLPPLTVAVPPTPPALPPGPEPVLTGRPYRLRALVTQGNPLQTVTESTRVRQALREVEFSVHIGLVMDEIAYHADLILPSCGELEFEGVYRHRDDRAVRWHHQTLPRAGLSRPDWEIWIGLARALGDVDAVRGPAYWHDAFPLAWLDYPTLWAEFVAHTPGMGGMTQARLEAQDEPLRWPCPSVGHPGVSVLYADHPSWYEAAAALGAPGKRFLTASGKVEFVNVSNPRLPVFGQPELRPDRGRMLPQVRNGIQPRQPAVDVDRWEKSGDLTPGRTDVGPAPPRLELGMRGELGHGAHPGVGYAGRVQTMFHLSR